MTTEAKLVSQAGLWDGTQAKMLAGGDMGNSLAAAGTTLATAAQIVNDIAIFTTVGAGAGARLQNEGSAYITVFNNNATNALLVYPPTAAGVINGAAAGAGFPVAAGKSSVFATPDGKTWVATHSA
jgi:hypothetical protein